jgi:hypothetical protein
MLGMSLLEAKHRAPVAAHTAASTVGRFSTKHFSRMTRFDVSQNRFPRAWKSALGRFSEARSRDFNDSARCCRIAIQP